jgi:hypothetical protein
MHRFQTILSLITNPIRSHIPAVLAAVVPHVIFQNPIFQLSSSKNHSILNIYLKKVIG